MMGACAGADTPAAGPQGEWRGTITTEDGFTVVRNDGGSLWGGPARLVEEASIGVEDGAEEYLFSYVMGLHVTDEHIIVSDEQADIVRCFDLDGGFVGNLGRTGQGPGE